MSSRRSTSSGSRFTDEEINALVTKLEALLSDSTSRSYTSRDLIAKVLEETCKYIKRLHREVDGLSERLSQLFDTNNNNNLDLDTLRNLLQQ